MTKNSEIALPPLQGWALILGASSGFGRAVATTLAQVGMNIIGVHLDRRATMEGVNATIAAVQEAGREAWFFNVNAADADKRKEVIETVQTRFAERGKDEKIRILFHSLAFGTLRPFVASPEEEGNSINPKQIDMTLDVMAHSLIYWTQAIVERGLFEDNGRIYAMTSTGAEQVWGGYGAVSAAKAALQSHIRQLAFDLAPRRITANAICAGVTDTPALYKIPNNDMMRQVALRKNPSHRLTETMDVARALVALAQPCTYWLNADVIHVDGGEAHSG